MLTKELKSLLPLPWRKVVDEQSLRAIATAEGSETNNSPNQCGWLTYDWVVSIGKTLDKTRLGMLGIVCILTRGYLMEKRNYCFIRSQLTHSTGAHKFYVLGKEFPLNNFNLFWGSPGAGNPHAGWERLC